MHSGHLAVGGFPYLAEILRLRRAGVTRNVWFLPACESLYLTDAGGCNGESYAEHYPFVEMS